MKMFYIWITIRSYFTFLRSTKWNANLILACDFAELVSLCKVVFWKTHIPVRTPKWPPRSIYAGACHGTVTETCDKACGQYVSM